MKWIKCIEELPEPYLAVLTSRIIPDEYGDIIEYNVLWIDANNNFVNEYNEFKIDEIKAWCKIKEYE